MKRYAHRSNNKIEIRPTEVYRTRSNINTFEELSEELRIIDKHMYSPACTLGNPK